MPWKTMSGKDGVVTQQDSQQREIYQIFDFNKEVVDIRIGGDGSVETARLQVTMDITDGNYIDVRKTNGYEALDVRIVDNILMRMGVSEAGRKRAIGPLFLKFQSGDSRRPDAEERY